MKTLIIGVAVSVSFAANAANAEQTLNVDGTDYPLSALMATCQNITDNPTAQITCFSDISRMLAEQTGGAQEEVLPVPDALDALRSVAQYQDDGSGLLITGTDCNIQVLYYNNYFHISRRNISSIDLYSAQFDASKLQYDQIAAVPGAQAPLSKAVLEAGATATALGGIALDSAQSNFTPRGPAATLDAYAQDVASQITGYEAATFEFVLVHPQRTQASSDIWTAFEAFVTACKQ